VITTYQAAPDIDVLTSAFPIPGLGFVPINAFVLQGAEPVLVDTGPVVQREEFLDVLRTVIDVADLRWIWLTTPTPTTCGAFLDEERVQRDVVGVGVGEPIHRRSATSMTVRRTSRNSSRWTTGPVSTRTGSAPCRTKALIGTNPSPGMGKGGRQDVDVGCRLVGGDHVGSPRYCGSGVVSAICGMRGPVRTARSWSSHRSGHRGDSAAAFSWPSVCSIPSASSLCRFGRTSTIRAQVGIQRTS